jgi:TetR/AcrR family tetracycline transcriptional repressor
MAIEREKILDAALALLNEVGLDQFSTRRLAERLGVQQPALYWHFRSKSELLDELSHEILVRFHDRRVPRPEERWDDFTLATARSFRRALLAVRDGARVNAGTRPTDTDFADYERQLELYVTAGFTAREALNIAISITRYVVGYVLEEQDERDRAEEEPDLTGDPLQEVAAFPILAEAMRPLIDGSSINTEAVFEGGLAYMLAGMRLNLDAKPARAPPKRRSARQKGS